MQPVKLFYSPGACSLSPHIVLRMAGLPFSLSRVNLDTKTTAEGGDYRAINPKGSVPALQLDDGPVLTEGTAIVQYIADQVPATGLVPAAGTLERYRLMELLNFISTEIHKTYSPLFKRDTPETYKASVVETLKARYAYVEAMLQGRDYLMGDRFTVADAYLFTATRWAGFLNIDLSGFPRLAAFMDRVGALPQVRDAIAAE